MTIRKRVELLGLLLSCTVISSIPAYAVIDETLAEGTLTNKIECTYYNKSLMSSIAECTFETEEIIDIESINKEDFDLDEYEFNYTDNVEENIDDLNVQLNDLYQMIGNELNISSKYVKIIHLIAGGKAIYDEKMPNIFIDTTNSNFSGAFDIDRANQEYSLIANWIKCPDDDLVRPSKYYLPDAAYSVTKEIVDIMNKHRDADRGPNQLYFNSLDDEVRNNIVFCEAILEYTGSDEEIVNNFYNVYERILNEKSTNENILESDENGNYRFKENFYNILINNGIFDNRDINNISYILRYDSKLAASSNVDELSIEYNIPYKLKSTSRENLMLAAMSVVGKVRYVWGGGHGASGSINGINPIWQSFYNSYSLGENPSQTENCIKPNNGWCPIHGTVNGGNGCLMKSNYVYSIQEYLAERSGILDPNNFENEAFINLINIQNGIQSHRLDGLDCSGYMSWLFNQITERYHFDSGARNFINQPGMVELEEGSKILPGDVFSWGDHIMMIVGPYRSESNVYIVIESGPSTVKFSIGYLEPATDWEIQGAKKLANEANLLFGNLQDTDRLRIFNMSTLKYAVDDYSAFGRLNMPYIDENSYLDDIHKRLVDMTAQEIIQHIVNLYSAKYLSGVHNYNGELFDIERFKDINLMTGIDLNTALNNFMNITSNFGDIDISRLDLSPYMIGVQNEEN